MGALVYLIMLCAAWNCGVLANYCSTNTFNTNNSFMHFIKEPIPLDYGIQGQFKSIHCCVIGYKSIEWFKDGVAYPWSAGVSNFILYPEAANQTLYTRQAASTDSGNYTCRLTNDTHTQSHIVRLDILDKATDAPKTMFVSKDQWVDVGEELRLYCEALIGRSYLADARSDLCWYKVWPNGTEGGLGPTQIEIKNNREDEHDVLGSYLKVERMSPQDFGKYVCVVRSNDVPLKNYVTVHNKYNTGWLSNGIFDGSVGGTGDIGVGGVRWGVMAAVSFSVVLAVVSAVVLLRRCAPRLLLAARHARARHANAAHRARVLEKDFDVLVCWTAVDDALVRGALLPTLTLKYKYRVLPIMISTQPDTWYEELCVEAGRCRSVVGVLSPAQYSPRQLLAALRQLRALPLPPVVVLLQDLPKLKREAKESGESLVGVLRRTKLIAWRHLHERNFWTTLRLALPLPPTHTQHSNKTNVIQTDEKNSRSCSLTALV